MTRVLLVLTSLLTVLALAGCGGGDDGGGDGTASAETATDPNAEVIEEATDAASVEKRVRKAVDPVLRAEPDCWDEYADLGGVGQVYSSEQIAVVQDVGGIRFVTDPTESVGVTVIAPPDGNEAKCLRLAADALAKAFPDGP